MELEKLRTKVDQAYDALDEIDLYKLLDVQRDATDAQIKRAFHAKARIYHVDNYPGINLGPLRMKMQRIFGELSRAQKTLSDPAQREEYDAGLSLSERGIPTDVRQIFAADEAFRGGKRLVERGALEPALVEFRKAVKANQSEPDYWAYLYWAEYGTLDADEDGRPFSRADENRILAALEELADENEKCVPARVFLGHIARTDGEVDLACRWYNDALEIEPGNVEATSNLRLLRMRESKKPGLFARLFGKK